MAGLVSSAIPHKNPYRHQSRTRPDSFNASVAQSKMATKSADSDVSHIHSNGIMTAFGKRAHSHAAALATPNPAMRFPAQKIGTHAPAEKRMLRMSATKNDRSV